MFVTLLILTSKHRIPSYIYSRTECPDGVPMMSCDGDPCTNAVCPSDDSAECRPNYCGGCIAEWFVGDTVIQCHGMPT